MMGGSVFSRWSHGAGAIFFLWFAGAGTHPDWLLGLLSLHLGIALIYVVRKNDYPDFVNGFL